MAAPHVTATAALVVASGLLGPDPTPDAIERRLKQTARDLGPPGKDPHYGAGLLSAAAATDPRDPGHATAATSPAGRSVVRMISTEQGA